MKYNILIIGLAFILNSCSSSPKVIMKDCKKLQDDFYECSEVPQKPIHEPHGRF